MKRLFSCILILLLIFVLNTCATTTIDKRGIESFNEAESSLSMADNIVPNSILEKKNWNDCNHRYFYQVKSLIPFRCVEHLILWFQFDETEYESMKTLFLAEKEYTKDSDRSYAGYDFCFEQSPLEGYGIPYWFNSLAFCDSRQTVVLLGYYCNQEIEDEPYQLAEEDWGAFLEYYYSDVINWTGTNPRP